MKNENELVLGLDIPFHKIDKSVLRLVEFVDRPEKGPYGFLLVESHELARHLILPIFHAEDYGNAQEAMDSKATDQEVLVIWSSNNYKYPILKYFPFFPRMIVWLCKKDAFNLINDPNHKPELQGEARFLEEKPIKEWKPGVMA